MKSQVKPVLTLFGYSSVTEVGIHVGHFHDIYGHSLRSGKVAESNQDFTAFLELHKQHEQRVN